MHIPRRPVRRSTLISHSSRKLTTGLAALNLAIPVYNVIHGAGLLLGMGGATRFAILRSQGAARRADSVFTHTLAMAAAAAAVFAALGAFAAPALAALLGADGATAAMTATYLRVLLLFSPAFLLNDVLVCFVRNDGAPQLAMAGMIGGSLSNVVLDWVFIFPCGWGIFGAAFATGLAPMISMAILSPHWLRRKNRFRPVGCRISARMCGGILSSGVPSLVTEVSSGVVIIVFNSILMDLAGNTGVAAYGVIANLSLVVIAVYTGIAQGIQPIISSSYGRGEAKAVSAILRYAVITMLAFSVVIYAGILFGAPQIAAVFNSEGDPQLQQIAEAGLRLYFTACPFAGFNVVISMYFTSTERPIPAHVISLLRGFLIIVPMAFVLSHLIGLTGTWCAFPATEALVAIIGLVLAGAAPARGPSSHGDC